MPRLFERAQKDSCTTGKSTIGDEKEWNVFMRLDREEAKRVSHAQLKGLLTVQKSNGTERPRISDGQASGDEEQRVEVALNRQRGVVSAVQPIIQHVCILAPGVQVFFGM